MRRLLQLGLLLLPFVLVVSAVMGGPDARGAGSPNPDIQKIIAANERFTYEVRYGFLRLGNVYVYLNGNTVHRGTEVVHMVTEMVSNSRIPLVGYREHHYHNYMVVNDSLPYGLRFWHNSIHDQRLEHYLYEFDYEAGYVYVYVDGERYNTVPLDQPADGGSVLMHYARLFAGTDQKRTLPICIGYDLSDVQMSFSSEAIPFESPAFPDTAIRAFAMEGYADFEGPFGFSGDFTAYFMDDELRIPLEVRVSIFLGSVRVRLTEYERLN